MFIFGANKTSATASGRGYALGGFNNASSPLRSSAVNAIDFATDAALGSVATLPQARMGAAGFSTSGKGYASSGTTADNTYVKSIVALTFAGETAANIAAQLALARVYIAGVQSSVRGYACGGYVSAVTQYAEIDGLQFSDESAINPAAALAVARLAAAGIQSDARGYVCGGQRVIPSNLEYAEIDGLQFDTEAAINPAAALSVARHAIISISSTSKGYLAGGHTTVSTTLAETLTFATEARATMAASLPSIRAGSAGVVSSLKGYALGGLATSTYLSSCVAMPFETETFSNISATMTETRAYQTGIQSS